MAISVVWAAVDIEVVIEDCDFFINSNREAGTMHKKVVTVEALYIEDAVVASCTNPFLHTSYSL